RRGWIGVRIQDETEEYAEGLGMERAIGALIAGLTESGPAEQAGIKSGDVVDEFDGKPVETMPALPRLVADTPAGGSVDVTVVRESGRVTFPIEVGVLEDAQQVAAVGDAEADTPDDAAEAAGTASLFGLTLAPLTEEARQTYTIGADVEGVLVAAVEAGS